MKCGLEINSVKIEITAGYVSLSLFLVRNHCYLDMKTSTIEAWKFISLLLIRNVCCFN